MLERTGFPPPPSHGCPHPTLARLTHLELFDAMELGRVRFNGIALRLAIDPLDYLWSVSMAEPAAVDLTCCQIRRQRLLDVMQAEGWTRVILTSYQAVQWISGARFATPFRPICSLEASGELVLVAPHKVPDSHAADTAVAYPAKWLSTMRSEQTAAAVEQWLATTGNSVCAGKIAIEFGDAPMELTRRLGNAELHDVDPAMFALRRRKEADELRLLRTAIAGTEKMYRVARELIRPGLTEIELFNHLQTLLRFMQMSRCQPRPSHHHQER